MTGEPTQAWAMGGAGSVDDWAGARGARGHDDAKSGGGAARIAPDDVFDASQAPAAAPGVVGALKLAQNAPPGPNLSDAGAFSGGREGVVATAAADAVIMPSEPPAGGTMGQGRAAGRGERVVKVGGRGKGPFRRGHWGTAPSPPTQTPPSSQQAHRGPPHAWNCGRTGVRSRVRHPVRVSRVPVMRHASRPLGVRYAPIISISNPAR
jgi:hypothetical protein